MEHNPILNAFIGIWLEWSFPGGLRGELVQLS